MSSTSQAKLAVLSFHSVKGGVGKSTLAYACARELARMGPTWLVDMDLTGTSLADVLPARAPGRDLADTRALIELRGPERLDPGFINDFLLRTAVAPEAEADALPAEWTIDAVDNLRLLPSSALPTDLERMLPLIYDDYYAGFIEARLEWLLDRILERHAATDGPCVVVFDSPPTIPGLSAALLSLAMRLPDRVGLVDDSGVPGSGWLHTPSRLREARTVWVPALVSSEDLQDLRATDRWLARIPETERERVVGVLNRTSLLADAADTLERKLADPPGDPGWAYSGQLLAMNRRDTHLVVVPDMDHLRFFQGGAPGDTPLPDGLRALLARLLDE